MVQTGHMMSRISKLIEKAVELKASIEGTSGGGNCDEGGGELVSAFTSLQDVYKQLLFANLEYALDKKIDHDLWAIFKSRITSMQKHIKNKNVASSKRAEVQSQLTSFLDSATGFYSGLLQELCLTFDVEIPGRIESAKLCILRDYSYRDKLLEPLPGGKLKSASTAASGGGGGGGWKPKLSSCQYMCQHCLVHLGDIARYRKQNGQAESYYYHAAQLLPSSGHPYNQLAILAQANGDVLKMAFFYCRSITVKGPFHASDTNLRRGLSSIITGEDPKQAKISTSELVKFFLKFHACIFLKQKENELCGVAGSKGGATMGERLACYIRAHLRVGSLSHRQLLHMAFINLFSLHHLAPNGIRDGMPVMTGPEEKKTDNNGKVKNGDEHHNNNNNTWNSMLAFAMQYLGELVACLPLHSDELSEREHAALPAIKLLLDWLTTNSSILKRPDMTTYSRIWPRLAKVVNALENQDKSNDMNGLPLPEDIEVRGFIGLFETLHKLNFRHTNHYHHSNEESLRQQHACRCHRIYKLARKLAHHNPHLLDLSTTTTDVEESGGNVVFVSSVQPSPQHHTNGTSSSSSEQNNSTTRHDDLHHTSSAHLNSIKEEAYGGQMIGAEMMMYGRASSESGTSGGGDNLSQSDVLSASPVMTSSGPQRQPNRVTFVATAQQFSPSPYPNEQSPSPCSMLATTPPTTGNEEQHFRPIPTNNYRSPFQHQHFPKQRSSPSNNNNMLTQMKHFQQQPQQQYKQQQQMMFPTTTPPSTFPSHHHHHIQPPLYLSEQRYKTATDDKDNFFYPPPPPPQSADLKPRPPPAAAGTPFFGAPPAYYHPNVPPPSVLPQPPPINNMEMCSLMKQQLFGGHMPPPPAAKSSPSSASYVSELGQLLIGKGGCGVDHPQLTNTSTNGAFPINSLINNKPLTSYHTDNSMNEFNLANNTDSLLSKPSMYNGATRHEASVRGHHSSLMVAGDRARCSPPVINPTAGAVAAVQKFDHSTAAAAATMANNSGFAGGGGNKNNSEESYQLFPDTHATWGGISRGSNDGEGFGGSLLGTIGSERAAAINQNHHHHNHHHYSPWNHPTSAQPSASHHHHKSQPSSTMMQRNTSAGGGGNHLQQNQQQQQVDGSSAFVGFPDSVPQAHSLWSMSPLSSMLSSSNNQQQQHSASVALEQLIRQQKQQHAPLHHSKDDPPP